MKTQKTTPLAAVDQPQLVRPSWVRCIHIKDPATFPLYLTPWVAFQPLHQSALASTEKKTVVTIRLTFGWLRHQWTIAVGWSWPNR